MEKSKTRIISEKNGNRWLFIKDAKLDRTLNEKCTLTIWSGDAAGFFECLEG